MPTLTIDKLITGVDSVIGAKLAKRGEHQAAIDEVREACLSENRDPTDDEATTVTDAETARAALDGEIDALKEKRAEFVTGKERDEALGRLSREVKPGAAAPTYENRAHTGQEERQYAPHKERGFNQSTGKLEIRQGFKPGAAFERDVPSFAGDVIAVDVLPTPAMSGALAAVAAKGSAGSLAYAIGGTIHAQPDLSDHPDKKNPQDFPFQHSDFLSPVPGIANTFR